jgi:hypothetical protein
MMKFIVRNNVIPFGAIFYIILDKTRLKSRVKNAQSEFKIQSFPSKYFAIITLGVVREFLAQL